MPQPTLCMIFEAIGPYNAIGKVAMQEVHIALAAGWRVTVVAKLLDESLRADVEWLRLYVPPRLFYVQWTTARHFIRKALNGRTFDVVHAHQPQVADLSDVFQCHFLTRAAYERKCFEDGSSLYARLMQIQHRGVLHAEDRFYKRWNPLTRMLFCSEMLRQEFHRIYSSPPLEEVLSNSVPPMCVPTNDERRDAKRKIIGFVPKEIVVGYLGGVNERKGYRELIEGMESDSDLFLLMGGQFTKNYAVPSLNGRCCTTGLVDDLSTFYAACDIFAVPSRFDPCPLVVFEAAARGVPVIASDGVGNLPTIREFGAGEAWNAGQPLEPLIGNMIASRGRYQAGGSRMAETLSETNQSERLLSAYRAVLHQKGTTSTAR